MVYRVEVSPNARSSCKATTCGKAKIEKGELRLGTWVKGPGFESWSWRHWGCFTPQQIVNARKPLIPEGEEDEEGMEIDMKLFDGWEELSDEQQDKVRIALEVGHVDDEDWKGDVALNRKGAKKARGKSTPAAKKGKKKDDDDEEEEAVETDEEPAPKKSTKKTSTASTTTTTTSKKRTPAKKSAPTPTPSPSASPEPVKPQKSTTSKRAAKPVAEPTRPRSSRATAATPKKYTEVNESADDDSLPAARKPRTPGKNAKPANDGKKSVRKGRGKKAGGDSDTEGEDAEMALHADEGAGEDTVDPPVSKAQSKGRDGRRKRGAAAVVDDVQGEIDEEEEQPKKKRTKAKPTPTKKEQSVKTKKATTTPASDKKTKTKAKDSAKETSEAKDKGELGKSIFGGE